MVDKRVLVDLLDQSRTSSLGVLSGPCTVFETPTHVIIICSAGTAARSDRVKQTIQRSTGSARMLNSLASTILEKASQPNMYTYCYKSHYK